MALCTPLLGGPLTAWCSTILVEGTLPGATVVVRSLGPNPRVVIKDLAGGGSDRMVLLAGMTLEPGDRLVVQQHIGAELSEWTPVFGMILNFHCWCPNEGAGSAQFLIGGASLKGNGYLLNHPDKLVPLLA